MTCNGRAVFTTCLCLIATVCGAQNFSLQQVMSAPFSSELKASPRGAGFLWISNTEGKRNLFLAEPGKGADPHVRQLTHYTADDGQDLGDAIWTPDASAVIYVRGGDFEFPGTPDPNPALLPQGVKQEIWLVPTTAGDPRKLAEGRAPAISPDGQTLAYILNDQVWTLSLQTPDAKPSQLFHGRGKQDGLRWSPDGHNLAFVSHRTDHSFIGLYSFDTRELSFPGADASLDQQPAWSPDGGSLAYLQLPAHLPGSHTGPHRSGSPWAIIVVNPKTGEKRELWRAHVGPGSVFHDLVAEDQLAWTADDRIVFPSEQDGWLHLYSIPATGGTPLLLTPGAFEVEHVTLSHDRATLLYASNQYGADPLDADRRHIWSVSPKGGAPRQLTTGSGIEVSPAISADGTLAVLRSDPRLPIRPALVSSPNHLRDLAPELIPASFPASKLIVPQQVLLTATDGMQIHGQLFLPPGADDQHKRPALIFVHGGSRRQMLLGWHYMDYYSNAYAENQYLANLGYIVLSINYRSGIGYGLNFREALDYGPSGASEFNDVLGAGLFLKARPDVDSTHIGIWGGSYGGYLTALALARASSLFAAGVDMHGVHDWNLQASFAHPAYRADLPPQDEQLAWQSSPMSSLSGWRSPVLLMQGDDDRNVPFSQTVQLANMLRAQGTPVEEHIFPDEIHAFLLHRTWIAAYTYEADFFDRYLLHPRHP